MKIAIANIRNRPDMPRDKVRADARSVADTGADVILFQEIGETQDHEDVLTGLVASGGENWALETGWLDRKDCNGPVAYRTDTWRRIAQGNVLLHGAEGKISGKRHAVWLDLELRSQHGLIIRFINNHFVANVWGPGDDKRSDHRDRVQTWNTDHQRWSTLIREAHRDNLPVVAGGDFNRGRVELPHPGATWVVNPEKKIDKVLVLGAAGIDFVPGAGGTVELNSDHPARWRTLKIRHDHKEVEQPVDKPEPQPEPEPKPTPEPPTTTDGDAARAVRDAWTVTGPGVEAHEAAQAALRSSWPALGSALDALADAWADR